MNRYGIKPKSIAMEADALQGGPNLTVNFRDVMDRSRTSFSPSGNLYLDLIPDRPSYLTELGKAKYYKDNSSLLQRVRQSPVLSPMEDLRLELGARKNVVKFLKEKEGWRSALSYLRESSPGLTLKAYSALAPKLSKIAPIAGLGGVGLLGSQLYKDKEQSSMDRLREALGLGD